MKMPIGANIPPHWILAEDDMLVAIEFPSRSEIGKTYTIIMEKDTRDLSCDCLAYQYNKKCSHVGGVVWCCYKTNKRKTGANALSIASIKAFSEDDLGARQLRILGLLRECGRGLSNKDISEMLRTPINTVTPRVKELREMGLVEEAGKQYDGRTNRYETIWRAI